MTQEYLAKSFSSTGRLPQIDSTFDLAGLINQKYRYLSEGGTSFAFISSDEKIVLKCFKTPAGMLKQYATWGIALTPSINRETQLKAAKVKISRDFESTYRAYNNLKFESGLLYAHTTPGQLPVRTLDVEGHVLDITTIPFVLQKKATLVGERLKALQAHDDEIAMVRVIVQLTDFIHSLWSKGWVDTSMFFHHNIGYLNNDRLMQIDTGDFLTKDESLAHKRKMAQQYIDRSGKWLAANYSFLQDEYITRMTANLEIIC